MTFDVEAFAAERDSTLLSLADRLRPLLADALARPAISGAVMDVLAEPFRSIYEGEGGDDWDDAFSLLRGDLNGALARTTPESSPDRMATWLATAVVNRATIEASSLLTVKQWVTMRDEDVRDIHRPLDGVRRLRGETFPVGGFALHYPAQPVGPPEVWINCRCVVALLPFTSITDAFALDTFAEHDLIWVEGRRTPKVVPRGQKYTPKPSEGRIVKRRKANADEERTIRNGGWVRVAKDGKKPSDSGYKRDNPSKIRPKLAQEVAMPDTDVRETEQDVLDDLDFDPAAEEEGPTERTPWYGILAPEGVKSGDGRSFDPGALSNRDLPLPLLWQPENRQGHDGAVVVGNIQTIERDDSGMLRGSGFFAQTEEADKVVGLIAEGNLRGVSVDVDDAEMAVEDDGQSVRFSRGRISAATIVPIPAFHEAFIALGTWEDAESLAAAVDAVFREYDRSQRDKAADKGQAMPDGSFPIKDVEDLRNAIQAVGRAKDYDKAKRHIIKRARALGHEELLPEEWAGDVEAFKRGAGWVTNPTETRRLHRYWTTPGQPGFAKIAWGTPGDFTRCTKQLRKYISPVFLMRTCAEWHHDALGYWPGELGKPGNPPDTKENRQRAARHASGETEDCDDCAEAVTLVAAATTEAVAPPAEHFADPGLTMPTGMTIDGDHIYGHLALWDTCHLGIDGVCVTPPRSATGYAYFATGLMLTDDGAVPVGQITMDTGHAELSADPFSAKSHYDNTGLAVADVTIGDDAYGIWFSGHMRTDDAEVRRRLLAAGLSGDWRSVRGNLELVAALAVNTPGFPVPRFAYSGGVQTALITGTGLYPGNVVRTTMGIDVDAVVDRAVKAEVDRQRRLAPLRAFASEDLSRRVAALHTRLEA